MIMLQALIDKICDASVDSAQLAQKVYDVLLLVLSTLPDTANIMQRLLSALQAALQAGSNSLVLAQLVLNLMHLPVVRQVSFMPNKWLHFAAYPRQCCVMVVPTLSTKPQYDTVAGWTFGIITRGTSVAPQQCLIAVCIAAAHSTAVFNSPDTI